MLLAELSDLAVGGVDRGRGAMGSLLVRAAAAVRCLALEVGVSGCIRWLLPEPLVLGLFGELVPELEQLSGALGVEDCRALAELADYSLPHKLVGQFAYLPRRCSGA